MSVIEVKVPDIGDFKDVPVIEILVKVGDTVKAEDALVTLESDKATMDVPSPAGGVVKEIKVKLGDSIGEGHVILLLEAAAAEAPAAPAPAAPAPAKAAAAAAPVPAASVASLLTPPPVVQSSRAATPAPAAVAPAPVAPAARTVSGDITRPTDEEPTTAPPHVHMPSPAELANSNGGQAHASPSIRQFARELGADINKIPGTGPKGRITKEDVQAYIKGVLTGTIANAAAPAAPAAAGGGELGLLPWPKVDFTKFGEVDVQPLSRIKKISGANLHRNWVMIPHVTQYDETDVTELEAFRVALNKEHDKSGVKFTLLAFVIKACVAALKKYPQFNASLDGDNLVFKKYFHIGFAADTPNGLVVPVIKNTDQKSLTEIAQEMAVLSKNARDGKLMPADMQGGCFSISSLGGIGGTYFTPLINAPEVAIIGLSKVQMKPVWDGEKFIPRQIMPLSLSYDHRVIDGAEGARFVTFISKALADLRRTLV
ncbi:MAG TPA: dihydrolipoyllysine-residue acetyltransferase [Rhodocyclaceae bacterium]|nr:dihydrolipoyllysine-residue acetyltransferase [Rhodocyclaceae bacterium]